MNDTQSLSEAASFARGHGARTTTSILDRTIFTEACGEALRKLHPRSLARNPVMFVVAVVATLATVLFLRDVAMGCLLYTSPSPRD